MFNIKGCLHPFNLLTMMFLLINSVASSAATDHAATEQVQAQLVASANAVHPGDEIYFGVHQRIIPHWHTYWKNPGDSGIATTINWKLPAGSTAGDIIWPTPNRSSLGPVTNYSYENEVTLLTKILVPKDAKVGNKFSVFATVDWLVCREECIPQQVKLSLSLPIIATNQTVGVGSNLISQTLAQLPIPSPWLVSAQLSKDVIELNVSGAGLQSKRFSDVWFYPDQWGKIAQSADQPIKVKTDAIIITLKSGDVPLKLKESLTGVLVIKSNSNDGVVTRGFNVNVIPRSLVNTGISRKTSSIATTSQIGFSSALFLALLGGIILNLMPCVFPVLSFKALSLVSHANQSPLQMRIQGIAYAAGVLASFAFLGGILILLKVGGTQIGWGFQFQSPIFVLAVAYLMFVVGLSLSGVFTIGGSISGIGSNLADKSGYTGSFFTGVLATIVATPCTAPFMAAAVGYALTQPAFRLLAIFLSLGFGLALPYVLLTSWPALQKILPRPGVWMERAKQVLAFPMYATTVWLVWVLAQQAGANAVAVALGGMVLISFAAWLYDVTRHTSDFGQRSGFGIASLSLITALIGGYTGLKSSSADANASKINGAIATKHREVYTPERLELLLEEGKPVFLNFTASWCISCLVNERVALSNGKVIDAFTHSGITYLKGDWTNRDAHISEILSRFGRSGVPLYVYYPAGGKKKPIELPQILTPEIVLSAIKNDSSISSN